MARTVEGSIAEAAETSHSSGRKPLPKKFTWKEEALGDEYVYQYTEGRDATDQYSEE
jgi:hypothetical protein